jgi:hypothetical protein
MNTDHGNPRMIRTRGTVSLVALCFVAVLGISLAGYIAVCSRAMTLSNRSFQGNLGQQLAELGLEEALRAVNKNDWSDWSNGGISVDWDTSTYSASKRAVATLTFSSGKFGQGTSATVKIRVDNYDAAHLGAAWSSSANYRINDLVGRNGVWYRCVKAHSNQTPNGMANLAYWAPAPVPWTWQPSVAYKNYDVVCYNGVWYRCTSAHTSPSTWTGANWTSIPSISLYNGSTSYSNGDIVYFPSSTTWYRYSSGSWLTTAGISWQYLSGTNYSFNDVVYYYSGGSYTWYRYINSTSASGNAPTNTTYWENALSGTNTTTSPGPYGWSSSGIGYNLWDTVYYSGLWYRCIKAHTSSGSIIPTNPTYWSNTPLFSNAWDSGRQYSRNDTVRYNGVWYLSLQNSNTAQNPVTATTYWIGANTSNSSYTWNATTSYSAGAYRCYGGVWYKCLTSHANKSPNDTTYWTASWANSADITTGASVAYAEASVSIANNPPAKTQLRASLAPASLFPNAAGAATNLTITTGTGTVDSYDSDVGAYGGSNITYSAVLAAGSTLAINGTTAVKGYLAWPSPPSGISTGTTVKGATSPASPNVDKSRVNPSPYVPQFDTVPSGDLQTAWSAAHKGLSLGAASTVNIGTPGAITPSRYYYSSTQLQTGTSESIQTININGPVILYLYGSLRMRTGGTININGSGSAEIHVGKQLLFESGNNGVVNRAPTSTNPDPKRLSFIVHNTASDAEAYRYVSTLYGLIYMPYTTNSAGLDIKSGVDIYGALSAKNITFSSEANLHYDTTVRYATFSGVDQPRAISEWRELPASEQATMP